MMILSRFVNPFTLALLVCAAPAGPVFGQRAAGLLSYTTPAYISFSTPEFVVADSQTNAVITVMRTGEFRVPATVKYSTQDGTAVAGRDYSPAGGTLQFPAGVGIANFAVVLHGSASATGAQLRLVLTGPGPGVMITQPEAKLTIAPAAQEHAPALPSLSIRPGQDGQIVISWANVVDNGVLEKSADPTGGTWDAVAMPPQIADGVCTVVEPAQREHYFYRLNLKPASIASAQ